MTKITIKEINEIEDVDEKTKILSKVGFISNVNIGEMSGDSRLVIFEFETNEGTQCFFMDPNVVCEFAKYHAYCQFKDNLKEFTDNILNEKIPVGSVTQH